MENNYIVGQDALDIARLSGVYLNRSNDRLHDDPVYSWSVVETLVASGTATLEEFYINLAILKPQEAADIIHCLIGTFKAWHDYRISSVA